MNRQETMNVVARHRDELRAMGVKSLALFGSLARDEANALSDADFLIEFDRPVGFFHFYDVQEFLQRVLGVAKVDLVTRASVYKELQDSIFNEAIDVI
jgi:uncharacterized protein